MTDLSTLLIISTAALLIAGTVKGAIGIGLPTTSIGLMTLAIDPRTAIALVLVPMIVSNAWQVYRSGEIRAAFLRYLPFSIALMAGVWVTVRLTSDAPDRVLFAVLGVAILIFVAVNVTRFAPGIPDKADRPAQVGFGLIAGVMGGLTSVWAPPAAVYLAARQTQKDEFVRASGLLIFLGSLPLALGYLREGFVSTPLLLVSVGLLVPTILGFTLGEKLRRRLSEEGFRRILLGLFFLMGLNLLRRAIF